MAAHAVPVGSRSPGTWVNPQGYVMRLVKVAPGKWAQRMEHRLVWEDAHGPIPDGAVIHHANHDRTDNRLANLVLCATDAEHHRAHHGRLSPEHRAKISAAGRGRRHTPESRALMADAARRRAPLSAEARARIAETQRQRWANGEKGRGGHRKRA